MKSQMYYTFSINEHQKLIITLNVIIFTLWVSSLSRFHVSLYSKCAQFKITSYRLWIFQYGIHQGQKIKWNRDHCIQQYIVYKTLFQLPFFYGRLETKIDIVVLYIRKMKFVSGFLVIIFGTWSELFIWNTGAQQGGNMMAILKFQSAGYSFLIQACEEADLVSMLESRKIDKL